VIQTIFSFIVVITLVVFVHELGHFIFARLFGVKVEQFSIGFGTPLLMRVDKYGTLWKICLIPLGGYIKMFGDANPASIPDSEVIKEMTTKEKNMSFHHKSILQKAIIIAAGPLANFALAMVIMMSIMLFHGVNKVDPYIGKVLPGSSADVVGLKNGDKIIKFNDENISSFLQVKSMMVTNLGEVVNLTILRKDEVLEFAIKPEEEIFSDEMGQEMKIYVLGISAGEFVHEKLSLPMAFIESANQLRDMSKMMLNGLWQVATGKRSSDDLGGPIKIAQYSGKSIKEGYISLLMFIVSISINLGIVNLLPIPMLDGGHLAFYLIELIIGKPINKRFMEYAYKIGFIILITIMTYAISNDIRSVVRSIMNHH
jgi:regulator of sigma E protease